MKRMVVGVAALVLACGGVFGQEKLPEKTERIKAPLTLKVGDAAPVVEVEKWLKGGAPDLKDGKVHVVEFWATWCFPCRKGMPHLTELVKKYEGKVEVVGVSVWEKDQRHAAGIDDPMPNVITFVEKAGDMMGYTVGADGLSSKMARSWVAAAGVKGIPAAFIVDQKGVIVWQGHPLFGMDEVLASVLAGTYTPEMATKLEAEVAEKRTSASAIIKDMTAAQKAGRWAESKALAEKLDGTVAFYDMLAKTSEYVALVNSSPEVAKTFGRKLVEEKTLAPLDLSELVRTILTSELIPAEKRDLDLAVLAGETSTKCGPMDYNIGGQLAAAYAAKGDFAKAAGVQKQVIAYMGKMGGTDRVKGMAVEKLAEYEKAAGKM